MQMISAEGGVHVLQEAGVVLAGEDDALTVRMVLPAGARPEGSEPVDLRQGDRILMANKKRIRSVDEFLSVYDALAVGDELKLGVRRGEQMLILVVPKADPTESGGRVMMMSAGGGPFQGGAPGPGGMQVRSFSMAGGPGGDVRPLFGAGVLLGAGEDGSGLRVVGRLPRMGSDGGEAELDLVEGDVLTILNGGALAGLEEFFAAYEKIEVGAQVELGLERDGESRKVGFSKPEEPKPMMIRKSR